MLLEDRRTLDQRLIHAALNFALQAGLVDQQARVACQRGRVAAHVHDALRRRPTGHIDFGPRFGQAQRLLVQIGQRLLQTQATSEERERFGKSSEKLSPDQFNLPLEDAELAQGVLAANYCHGEIFI